MGKTCFLIGHRESSDEFKALLDEAIERHITEYGVTDFVVGGYGGFDRLARRALLDAKEEHPEIVLSLLVPYHPYDHPVEPPKGFDQTFYPPGMETVPKRAAIVRANQSMVSHSDFLIACVWHSVSNAKDLLEYARRWERRGLLHIQNLGEVKLS